MTDKDRKAFDTWFNTECNPDASESEAWMAWQAARDHYASRPIEVGTIENAARAMAAIDFNAQEELRKVFNEPSEDKALYLEKQWRGYVDKATAALSAAGMRFKDSGDERR